MSFTQNIEAALEYCSGKYDLANIQYKLSRHEAQAWETEHSAVVTWLEDYPCQRVLTLAFAGGDKDELKGLIPEIRRFAKDIGCQALEVHGRAGWERVLKEEGFKKVSTVLRCEL